MLLIAEHGGIAQFGSFSWDSDTPALVFEDSMNDGDEKFTAEAISHEVGHTLGVMHDGRINPLEEYYEGHGTGPTSWGSIMGVGYYTTLTQWSRGEYASASNFEDDLEIITTQNGFGYRQDDFGDSDLEAFKLTGTELGSIVTLSQQGSLNGTPMSTSSGSMPVMGNQPADLGRSGRDESRHSGRTL